MNATMSFSKDQWKENFFVKFDGEEGDYTLLLSLFFIMSIMHGCKPLIFQIILYGRY